MWFNEKVYLTYFLFHNFVDEFHEECHDETVTEMVTETIMEEQCTGKVISAFGIKKKILSNHILIPTLDILFRQFTMFIKVLVAFVFRTRTSLKNFYECCYITSISNLLLFSWFCRWGSWRMYWHNCYQMHTKIWGTSCWITCCCNDKKYLPWFHWKKM